MHFRRKYHPVVLGYEIPPNDRMIVVVYVTVFDKLPYSTSISSINRKGVPPSPGCPLGRAGVRLINTLT